MNKMITVGGFTVPVDKANRMVRKYVTQYGSWSYPAYDGYLREAPTEDVNSKTCSLWPSSTLASSRFPATTGC